MGERTCESACVSDIERLKISQGVDILGTPAGGEVRVVPIPPEEQIAPVIVSEGGEDV